MEPEEPALGLGWLLCGWIGQACFFSRFFVQWALSERARRPVAPRVFWWLSLAGSLLLIAYTLRQDEFVFLIGAAVTTGVYVRNLWIQHGRGRRSALGPLPAMLISGLACILVWVFGSAPRPDHADSLAWMLVAFVGQGLWSTRFLVQWYYTERTGESHFPVAFWWFSLIGNALMLAYALHVGDPVWIAGFVPGPIVQVRNLMLAARARAQADRTAA